MTNPIKITLYRWGGSWGPFSVKIPCGECTLTKDILADTFATELSDVPIELEVKDWLTYWWEPLKYGAWHAPIVVVENKVVSQGEALNRGALVQSVIKEWAQRDKLTGNIVFGKATCPFCVKAKQMLDNAGIEYQYYDVVKDSAALYRMIPEVKAIIGEKTPVTVPQIWMKDNYIGGADSLEKWLDKSNAQGLNDSDTSESEIDEPRITEPKIGEQENSEPEISKQDTTEQSIIEQSITEHSGSQAITIEQTSK